MTFVLKQTFQQFLLAIVLVVRRLKKIQNVRQKCIMKLIKLYAVTLAIYCIWANLVSSDMSSM